MAIRGKWLNKFFRFFESTTQESIPVAPVMFYDEFMNKLQLVTAGENTVATWDKVITGAAPPTVGLTADAANGVVTFALTADNQKQEAGLHWNNERSFALDHGVNFEAYINPSVLCTGQSEMYLGLAGDYVEGPIAEADAGPAEHLFFCLDGGGAITIHTDDTSTDNNAVATGVTLTNADWAVLRIDTTDPTNVLFYINGSRVASGTTFTVNATPTLALQPFIMVHKETGTGLGTLKVDYVRVWSDRS